MITDLASARLFIKTMLGSGSVGNGVINVEISVEQLNQAIENAVQKFQRYNQGEGTYEDYLILTLSAGVSAYSLEGSSVSDVVDFSLSTVSSNNINHLFSPANLVLGGSFNMFNYGGGMALSQYQVAMNYLAAVSDVFNVMFKVDYIELQERLILTPTPTESGTALIKVFKKESATRLYNHTLVKDLMVAIAKQIWGRSLSKYRGIELPGKGEASSFGSELRSEGKEEEKETIEKMKYEGEWWIGFTTG